MVCDEREQVEDMKLSVPSLQPGERSLPAELRTPPGHAYGLRRLQMNLVPSAQGMRRAMGMRGLGCDCSVVDESGSCVDPEPCNPGDTIAGGPGYIPTPTPTPITTPATTSTPNISCDSVSPSAMTAQQLINCGYTTLPSGALNTPLTPAQAGLTPAQQAQLIAATGNAAVSLIRTATGGPYTVAGTNLVYNPATGSLTTAAGANAVSTLLAGGGALGLSSNTLLLVGGAAVLLFVLMGSGGRR